MSAKAKISARFMRGIVNRRSAVVGRRSERPWRVAERRQYIARDVSPGDGRGVIG